MALSSGSKKGLALGALLPVLLSVYSETRKQADAQAQHAAAHFEERQKHRDAVQARDLDSAKSFLVQITGDGADPDDTRRDGSFCDHLYIASELVRLTADSTATQAAVIGALQYRSERPQVSADTAEASSSIKGPRVCQCPGTLEQMQLNWRPSRKDTIAAAPVIADMTAALDGVASKCSVDVATASPARVEATGSLPLPPPGPTSAAPGAEPPAASCAAQPAQALAADAPTIRVYIQIASEAQRDAATRVQSALRGWGYVVPGIERVGAEASPSKLQLRYIYDEDRADAGVLVGNTQRALSDCAKAASTPLELAPPLSQYRGRSLHRSFELWFPKMTASAQP